MMRDDSISTFEALCDAAEEKRRNGNARAGCLVTTPLKQVSSMSITEFLQRDFPPRENMLAPWLGVSSLALIYAWRGTGKTLVAHGAAWAVACGGGFLNWTAPKPQRVLLIDDLLATGGTACAATQLIEALGGEVAAIAFLIELEFLAGRGLLGGYDVYSVLQY